MRTDPKATSTALQLERLMLNKATEEINEWSRITEQETVRDFAARGMLQSGVFAAKIASIHQERAKRMVDKRIALRRQTMNDHPELATDEDFKTLSDSMSATVDSIFSSIPAHLKSLGVQFALDDNQLKNNLEIRKLKAYARLEIEILKREMELRLANRRTSGKRKSWRIMERTNPILVTSILAVAAVLTGLNHKVLPYWLMFTAVFLMLIGIGILAAQFLKSRI